MRAGGKHTGSIRVIFAPDSFKGTIHARAAAAALARGWSAERADDQLVCIPMADGGEGTLDAFEAAISGSQRIPVTVEGPLGRTVQSSWLLLPADETGRTTGVVELACTSGIELMAPGQELRAMEASSIGFGQAILAALDHGVDRLMLAVGSSASSDGGSGMLAALGARILDAEGCKVPRGALGLEGVAVVELSELRELPPGGAFVLNDVNSPLLGPSGAAQVFAPQKGASPSEVLRIERALEVWASLLPADGETPGAGAAGGVGFGLLAWGAQSVPGAEAVADLVGLVPAMNSAAVVITGEGSFDAQSDAGKAPAKVLETADRIGVKAIVVAGRIGASRAGIADTLSLTELAGGAEEAMRDPEMWLHEAGSQIAASFSLGSYSD